VHTNDRISWFGNPVAENPNAPVALLQALAKDKNKDVRCSVAMNPNAPIALLEALAKDKDSGGSLLCRSEPQRPRLDVGGTCERHGTGGSQFSRQKIRLLSSEHRRKDDGFTDGADSESLPESDALRLLPELIAFPFIPTNKSLTAASRNKDWLVRLGVALHPDASDAILELLSADSDADIAAARHKRAARAAANGTAATSND
jgi:hypothetical protein